MTRCATKRVRDVSPCGFAKRANGFEVDTKAGVNNEKSTLRSQLLTARIAAGGSAVASAAVCGRLDVLPELASVRTVLGYSATDQEVSVDEALRHLLQRGVSVCLPWVEGPMLGVAQVTDLDTDTAPGWRGVREPPPGRRVPLRPSALDAVLVPGVGFDLAGNRLGHGGGHFDRLLARVRRDTVLIGIATDAQIVAAVPVEPHDRAVHLIVTPTRTVRPSR